MEAAWNSAFYRGSKVKIPARKPVSIQFTCLCIDMKEKDWFQRKVAIMQTNKKNTDVKRNTGTIVQIPIGDAAKAIALMKNIPYPIEYSAYMTSYVKSVNKRTGEISAKCIAETYGRTFRTPQDLWEYLNVDQNKDQFLTRISMDRGRLYIESRKNGHVCIKNSLLKDAGIEVKKDDVLSYKQTVSVLRAEYEKGRFNGRGVYALLPKDPFTTEKNGNGKKEIER